MLKAELRKIFEDRRRNLSDEQWKLLSEKVAQNFFRSLELTQVTFLHTFIPIYKKREPDSWLIIDHLVEQYPKIKIVLPRINPESNRLENFAFESKRNLTVNSWGIAEPSGTEERVASSRLDLIVIPLLTFDTSGHRVGYGKGFYDKLLAEARIDAKRVGLSLFEGVEAIDDVDHFDEPLHYCITPEQVHQFK